jgi:hypothetical protein
MKNKQRNNDEQEMIEIRSQIAKDLEKAFKKGDGTKCVINPSIEDK